MCSARLSRDLARSDNKNYKGAMSISWDIELELSWSVCSDDGGMSCVGKFWPGQVASKLHAAVQGLELSFKRDGARPTGSDKDRQTRDQVQ